ncbi:hypothetical protein Q0Z83_092260 [Actinoplanes sichuanensis]|uniref:Lipoprotein n=1 Tax=Actinoplanes sichuanensis TaxID=512349 RepID=A0ABW4AM88_9ACTN|nr:hypothetical protein [Actinoplanes sichuanensis]BEL11035.1 hypothetical protein Q0Z83_092260 [Actinoplanes sichuanensis]
MRRAILAVLAGGVLVTSAACGDDAKNEDTAAPVVTTPAVASAPTPEASSAAPDFTADTVRACERLDKVFSTEFGDFGGALGKMIAYKEAKDTANATKAEKQAATELKVIGTQIRKETANAPDPELKSVATTSAQRIETSAKDLTYIKGIKSTKDLDGSLQQQIATWISPLAGYCGVKRAVETPSADASLSPAPSPSQ